VVAAATAFLGVAFFVGVFAADGVFLTVAIYCPYLRGRSTGPTIKPCECTKLFQ
jgi:hypothetical protein